MTWPFASSEAPTPPSSPAPVDLTEKTTEVAIEPSQPCKTCAGTGTLDRTERGPAQLSPCPDCQTAK